MDHKTLSPQNDRPTPVEQNPEAYTQEEITLFSFNIVNERDALAFEFLLLFPKGMCGTVNFLAEKTGGHTVRLENYSDGRICWGWNFRFLPVRMQPILPCFTPLIIPPSPPSILYGQSLDRLSLGLWLFCGCFVCTLRASPPPPVCVPVSDGSTAE